MYAEATLSHQRPIHFCQESWKILLGTGAGPGAGSSCGEPRWGSAQCLQGGEAQARELGQGGAGGLASGPDVRRLRLEFMGVVMSRLQREDSPWLAGHLTRFPPPGLPAYAGAQVHPDGAGGPG